jgi:fumarate hydratase class II
MLVTALSPVIGYGKASAIAHEADPPDALCGRPRWGPG